MHNTIDKILARLMAAWPIKQIDLAKETGVKQFTISRILNPNGPKGIKEPTDKQVRPLADFFGISTDQLRGFSPLPIGILGPSDEGQEKDVKDESRSADAGTATAAEIVQKMLQSKAAKALSPEARERIRLAAENPLQEPKTGNIIRADFSRPGQLQNGDVLIPQYNVRAAMGDGQLPADYREFVRNIVVDKLELDDLGLKYTSVNHLKIISGWGKSMRGTIEDKSPVIIDVGVTAFDEEGVYLFTWLNHIYIKRVQILDAEHFMLVSDNKVFDPQKARMDDMYFHAKILGVWNFQKLS